MYREDIVGKSLKEALAFIPYDMEVAIGSEDASGFFCFEKAKDVLMAIENLKNDSKAKIDKKINNINDIVSNINLEIDAINKRLNNSEFKNPVLIEKKSHLLSDQESRKRSIAKLNEEKERIGNLNFADSIVKDAYNKKFDARIAILIPEKINPYYWSKDEYERKHAFSNITIEEVYLRYPELAGKYDVFI